MKEKKHGIKYPQVGNSWFLTGVVSFGTNACDSSLPGVYTRTSAANRSIGEVV